MIKRGIFNTVYFFKESWTLFRISLLSNLFSILSTGLIFFMLAMILSGWWISQHVGAVIQGEAEMNVYYELDLSRSELEDLTDRIQSISGVNSVRMVDAGEAYGNMEKILGQDAQVLQQFDDNPFSPYLELKIDIGQVAQIVAKVSVMEGVDSVRDNQSALNRLNQLGVVLRLLGYLIIAAVSVTTLIIIAHIIRQGIYSNKDQINTLKLLGAPTIFIALPFVLEGVAITLLGGIGAAGITTYAIQSLYTQMLGPLPFIPLPPMAGLIKGVAAIVLALSIGLGWLGSLFGLSAIKTQ